jgi:hypothetical protein
MGAAIHRLHEPASRYTPEERTRIMSAARVNSAQWKAEQQLRSAALQPISEVKHDYLAEALARPIEDRLTRYQREGREAEERRRAEAERTERESRREQRQAQRGATEGWTAWISAEVERRVAEQLRGRQDITRDLLKILDQHNETFERIAERLAAVKAENTELRETMAQMRSDFATTFATLTGRIATLEADRRAIEDSLRKANGELRDIKASKLWQHGQHLWPS